MTTSPNHLMSMNWRHAFREFYNDATWLKPLSIILLLSWLLTSQANAKDISYQQALTHKNNGEHAIAEQHFKQLIERNKNNAEYWFQLGLVQRFQSKHDLAMQSQQTAQSLAPDNHDIRLERARLLYWQQHYDRADTMVRKVLQSHPDYQEAIDLQASVQRAEHAPADPKSFKWQLDVGYENSRLSRRSQPDWNHTFMQIGHWLRDDTMAHLRVENVERFKSYNEYYEIGLAHIFNKNYNARFNIGHTPDSVFMPEWRLKTDGEARIIANHESLGDLWLTTSIQHDRYTNLNISIIKPGLRYEFMDNWQIHAQHINVIDENDKHLKGWSARLDWQTPLPELRIFTGLSDAPETENAIVINTRAHFGGLSYRMTPRVTLHAAYTREDRERSFIRDVISTALSIKF